MMNSNLSEAEIKLHEVIRLVEKELGTCRLTIEMERCAHQLAQIKNDLQQN
jgi:hypothetical protein